MLAPVCETEETTTAARATRSQRLRILGSTAPYRTKCDADPVMPLPRWTNWALVAWTLCAIGAYTAILARWWE